MLTFLGSIWWLAVTLGVLVTFHEFGHFWVARRCGVKVLRFSVGFGRALWSHTARDGCEYRIAVIPLGGYCKMLDAREGEVPEAEREFEFTSKSLWKRALIVLAGPGFNLLFAVLAFWAMFMLGRPGVAPTIGTPPAHTLAAQAGFQAGDTLKAINGHGVESWAGAMDALGADVLRQQPISVRVQRADGDTSQLELPLEQLPRDVDLAKAFGKIGLVAAPLAPVVAQVEPGSPAALAGLQSGDRILAIDGKAIQGFAQIGTAIQHLGGASPTARVRIQRNGQALTLTIHPKFENPGDAGGARWIIGITPQPPPAVLVRYGPLPALGRAIDNTWQQTATSFVMLGKMLVGHASTRNLSGLITIARVADTSAHMGLAWFLSFLGLVSLSLAVINLLPIPILDGGHLLYYLIEFVKGGPVSERAMVAGQFVGMAVIVTLMGLAFYNDILRLVS